MRLARHGSLAANPPELLAAVSPSVVVISVGADNRYSLPAPAVLESLAGRLVFRTDQNGSLSTSTDGVQVWLQPERQVKTQYRKSC